MKKLLLIAFLIGLSFVGYCQNAYYDAMKLKTAINGNQFDASDSNIKLITDILSQYVKLPAGTPYTFANIKAAIGTNLNPKNPFLAPYMQSAGDGAISASAISNSISSIGSTPVTNFADGLAKFLVKRAKQELLISFFQRFPELEKKYPEMRIIFPNTCNLVNNFSSWEYANILNTLKEALDKDLKDLLANLPQINNIDISTTDKCKCTQEAIDRITKYQTFLRSDEGIAISASMLIGSQFLSGNKLPDIINNVASTDNLAKIDLTDNAKEQNIKSALAFIRIMSNGLRNSDVTKNYVTTAEITALLSDTITRDIFFGLLYEQIKNENIIFNNHTVTDFFKPANINGITTYIQNFVDKSLLVSEAIKKLKTDKAANKDLDNDWAAIFQAINEFIPAVANVDVIDSRIKLPAGIQKIVEKSQFATTVAHDIAIKNYSAAIVGLLSQMHDDSKNEEFNEFKSFFVKYGSFAANVAQAENSDEVEQAIESVALPVGSASIKKKTCFSIAVNAYLGGFYGNEYLAEKMSSKWAPISGVYAPVGVTFSWGLNFDKKNYGSLSALINVVDIGAIASYRLQDDETEKLPEVTLQNIFAPGLGIVYGFPDFPLSAGWSYQFGPALRKINATEATTDQINRRWQFFLAVDIPIFNLYTRSK